MRTDIQQRRNTKLADKKSRRCEFLGLCSAPARTLNYPFAEPTHARHTEIASITGATRRSCRATSDAWSCKFASTSRNYAKPSSYVAQVGLYQAQVGSGCQSHRASGVWRASWITRFVLAAFRYRIQTSARLPSTGQCTDAKKRGDQKNLSPQPFKQSSLLSWGMTLELDCMAPPDSGAAQ
jgi:hypothetical protein